MESSMSRSEQLALYKKQKLHKTVAPAAAPEKKTTDGIKAKTVKPAKAAPGSVRSKVQMSAKSTIFQSSSRGSAMNDRNVVMAGKKKIGASTPIGKLQARIRAKTPVADSSSPVEKENSSTCNKNLFGSDDDQSIVKSKTSNAEFNKFIEMKLDEAEYLYKKHGCHVARAYLEELPKADDCVHLHLLSKPVYWLTWIKIERSDHQWERAEKLFMQADSLVSTSIDKRVISAAYEAFKEEADSTLESKMDTLVKSCPAPAAVPTYVPRGAASAAVAPLLKRNFGDVDESLPSDSSSTSTFHGVNVANRRKNYEGSCCSAGVQGQRGEHGSPAPGKDNVKNLAASLLSSMARGGVPGKSLIGGVALPGMPTAAVLRRTDTRGAAPTSPAPLLSSSSSLASKPEKDELSAFLGIGNDDDDDDDDEEVEKCDRGESSVDPGVTDTSASPPVPPAKKLCLSRPRVLVAHKAEAGVFSDSDGEQEDTVVVEEQVNQLSESLQSKNLHRNVLRNEISSQEPALAVATTTRRTRSGVCFADSNCSTPAKKVSMDSTRKRKVTPFKPHVDDLVISPY